MSNGAGRPRSVLTGRPGSKSQRPLLHCLRSPSLRLQDRTNTKAKRLNLSYDKYLVVVVSHAMVPGCHLVKATHNSKHCWYPHTFTSKSEKGVISCYTCISIGAYLSSSLVRLRQTSPLLHPLLLPNPTCSVAPPLSVQFPWRQWQARGHWLKGQGYESKKKKKGRRFNRINQMHIFCLFNLLNRRNGLVWIDAIRIRFRRSLSSADDFLSCRLDISHLQRSFLSRQDCDPLLSYGLCEAKLAAFFPSGFTEIGSFYFTLHT